MLRTLTSSLDVYSPNMAWVTNYCRRWLTAREMRWWQNSSTWSLRGANCHIEFDKSCQHCLHSSNPAVRTDGLLFMNFKILNSCSWWARVVDTGVNFAMLIKSVAFAGAGKQGCLHKKGGLRHSHISLKMCPLELELCTNLHHAWLKLCRVERQMTREGRRKL